MSPVEGKLAARRLPFVLLFVSRS